jgi:hypothetical protein
MLKRWRNYTPVEASCSVDLFLWMLSIYQTFACIFCICILVPLATCLLSLFFVCHRLQKPSISSYYSICSSKHSLYPIAHITMFWTTVMKTSYLHRVASIAPKLFRISRREWWCHIWCRCYNLYHLRAIVKIII